MKTAAGVALVAVGAVVMWPDEWKHTLGLLAMIVGTWLISRRARQS